MYDLLIKGGRVIDPSQSLDRVQDIAIKDGRIVEIPGTGPQNETNQELDAHGLIVTPGLIDLHAHVYEGGSFYGLNADATCLDRGVTTVADAGTAGAQNFSEFRNQIIESSESNILAFLHLSRTGLKNRYDELKDLADADSEAAYRTIEANRDVIRGIKIRMDPNALGNNGEEVLRLACELSNRLELPVMLHIGKTTPPLPVILEKIKPGDIITHCFHGRAGGILDSNGEILPEVLKAAEKGVIFDVGHGFGSFSFQIARKAMSQGFFPTTISSDLHTLSIDGPVFDLVTTMSKFLYLGVPLDKVIEMTTWQPARILGINQKKGNLIPGAHADITLLKLCKEPISLCDAFLNEPIVTVTADEYLISHGVIREGKVIFFGPKNDPPDTDKAILEFKKKPALKGRK